MMTLLTFLRKNKKVLTYCFRVVFTSGLFVFALAKVPVDSFLSVVMDLRITPVPFIAGFAGIISAQVLFAWRTHRLLAVHGMPSEVFNVFLVNFSSNFYNLIFPSSVAGGAVRWYRFGRPQGEHWNSFAVIIIERIMDNICWLTMLTVALGILACDRLVPTYYCCIAGVFLIAVTATVGIVPRLPGRFRGEITGEAGRLSVRLLRIMARVNDSLQVYAGKRNKLTILVVYSFCVNVLLQFFVYLLLTSVAGPLRFDIFLAASLVVYITSQIPLTVSGIGLNEVVFLTVCKMTGIDGTTGFLFGFTGSLVNIAFGLLGGIVELFSKGRYVRTSSNG